MADNTELNAGSGGDTIATDDVGGVKYQQVKLDGGGDGLSEPIPGTTANGLDVDVTRSALPSGASTEAKQDTQITAEQAIQATAGATTGAAVVTDANGTLQQYLRGIVKLLITGGTIILGAGSAAIGKLAANAGVNIGDVNVTDAATRDNGKIDIAGFDVGLPVAAVLQKVGTQIRFCVSGSFSPAIANTNWTIGSPTDVTLTLSAVASLAARQSNKVDLGATRAAAYEVLGCVDFTGETPTAGGRIDYYWLPSTSTTAATGNIGGGAGADAAFPTGSETGTPTLAEILALGAIYIGWITVHDGGVVQNGFVGVFRPTGRYGQLVVVNNSSDPFEADDVEMHQVFNPIVDERQ